MKNNNDIYKTIGVVFIAAGIIAISLGQTGMFAAWFPIGAAFFAIGSNGSRPTEKDHKKKTKK
jgi:hypothetical protein